MSFSKDNIKILVERIKALSPEKFLEEYEDTESLYEKDVSEVLKKDERRNILIAASTDLQLLAVVRQKFLNDKEIPYEADIKNEIENLWNFRMGLAERFDIPQSSAELSNAELDMLSKRMIEWFTVRKELKENPEGVKDSFKEGNIFKA
ncbi:MAG: hypothetical protein HY918_00795 [Candidatus Doudnabacteria bacterium]|nr:hypothetical protein [Candidatus Doudnabacteria bacterium]